MGQTDVFPRVRVFFELSQLGHFHNLSLTNVLSNKELKLALSLHYRRLCVWCFLRGFSLQQRCLALAACSRPAGPTSPSRPAESSGRRRGELSQLAHGVADKIVGG